MTFLNRNGSWATRVLAIALAAAASVAADSHAAIRYVNAGLGGGLNNGTSWANAFTGPGALTVALAVSVSGDEIWVARGTYLPSTTGVRTASFTLKTGVAIYGGFAGSEATLAARNWGANPTLLSGDLAGNDLAGFFDENSYHVLIGTGAGATAVLDGFTVQGGNANGTGTNQDRGGGILITSAGSNPTIRNCNFFANRCTFGGGAGYISPGGATFSNTTFHSNVGGSFGGAFDTNGATTAFERCQFKFNQAARAGAVESFGGASMTLTNCIFHGNSATGSNGGGAIWASATVTARNCTFSANTATSLAGCIRATTGANVSLGNCILWNNTGPGGAVLANQISTSGGTVTATYTVVQGTYAGAGNTDADPLFVNPASFDFRLQSLSPCIDAGSNGLVPAGTTTDIAGLPRFVDVPAVVDTGVGSAPLVDRGAHEAAAPPPPPCPADLNSDGLVDGADLGALLGQWNTNGPADLNHDSIVDGADLGILLGSWGACPA